MRWPTNAARCWPRLIQWLTANREYLRIRARVSEEAARWRSEGRLRELLLAPGKPLTEGEFLLKQQCQELDPAIVEYIESSRRSTLRARRAQSGRDGVRAFARDRNGCVVVFRLAVKPKRRSGKESPQDGRRKCGGKSAPADNEAKSRTRAEDATKMPWPPDAAEDEKPEGKTTRRTELLVYAGKLSRRRTRSSTATGSRHPNA